MDIFIEYTDRDKQYFMWRTIIVSVKDGVSFLQYVEREINNSTFQEIIANLVEIFDASDLKSNLDEKDFFEIKHKFKNSVFNFNSDPSMIVFLAKSDNETLEININKNIL